MIGRGYESRDLAAGSSRNASPTNHPDHPSPPPFCLGSPPIPCILRLPPSSSCAPLDTPQHHPSQPSRILVPHSSLFIHPSCTPSLWHHHRELVRLPPPPPPRFCTLHRADTLGVLNGIVATLLLATSKCRRRRLRRKRIRRRRRRYWASRRRR